MDWKFEESRLAELLRKLWYGDEALGPPTVIRLVKPEEDGSQDKGAPAGAAPPQPAPSQKPAQKIPQKVFISAPGLRRVESLDYADNPQKYMAAARDRKAAGIRYGDDFIIFRGSRYGKERGDMSKEEWLELITKLGPRMIEAFSVDGEITAVDDPELERAKENALKSIVKKNRKGMVAK